MPSEPSSKDKSRFLVRVCLVVDNRLMREALVRLFQKQTNLSVVGQNTSRDSEGQHVIPSECDVLILDSLDTLCALNFAADPDRMKIRIILFGMEDNPDCFLKAVCQGISGYLLKEASSAEMVAAVRSVVRGEAVCPNRLCMSLFDRVSQDYRQRSGMADEEACLKVGLTFRQRQLVSLVAKGMSNKEIAAYLNLSECTVKNHLYRIMKQLEAGSRQEAVDLIRAGGYFANA